MFHLRTLNDLSNVDHKMEAETIAQLQKNIQEEINDLKKAVRKSNASIMMCMSFPLCYLT